MSTKHNFFQLLGLPQRFSIDLAVLKANARKLQCEYHPDRYAGKTPQEQRLAAQLSAEVNSAQSTLQDPVRRAIYLLELAGAKSNAQTYTERDGEFLMQQMILREQLEDARMANDCDALAELAKQANEKFEALQSGFAEMLAAQGDAAAVAAESEPLYAQVSRMRFYQKLLEEIHNARSALDGRAPSNRAKAQNEE